MILFSRPVQFAVLLILVFAASLMFLPLRFETNDDIIMMMLASGAYSGDPTPNLVFINYILGLLLSRLYGIIPQVDWYPAFMLSLLSASSALMVLTAIERVQQNHPVGMFTLATLGALTFNTIIHMQFTTAAALSVAVGAWAFWTMSSRALRWVGAFLVLSGFLLRFEAAALVVVVSAPFAVLGMWRQVAPLSRGLGLGVFVVVGICLHMASERAYGILSPVYVAFNDIRGQLNDNPNSALSLESLPEGTSFNDYNLLLDFFTDPQEIDQDDLSDLQAAVEQNEDLLESQDVLLAFLRVLSSPNVQIVILALVLVAVGLPRPVQSGLLLAGGLTFLVPLFYISLFAILKERVLLSAVSSVLSALYFLNLPVSSRWVGLARKMPLIGLTVFYLLTATAKLYETRNGEEKFREQTQIVMAWDGTVFAYSHHLQLELARLFTADLKPYSQKVIVAGWMTGHPENQGYQSHRDLLRDGVALFLSPDHDPEAKISSILLGLSENYGITAEANIAAKAKTGLLVTFKREP